MFCTIPVPGTSGSKDTVLYGAKCAQRDTRRSALSQKRCHTGNHRHQVMRASQPDEKATVFAFLSLPCMDTDSVPVYVRTDGMDPFPLDTVGPWLPSSVRGTVLTEGTFLTHAYPYHYIFRTGSVPARSLGH
jgi:hypothetical protein